MRGKSHSGGNRFDTAQPAFLVSFHVPCVLSQTLRWGSDLTRLVDEPFQWPLVPVLLRFGVIMRGHKDVKLQQVRHLGDAA